MFPIEVVPLTIPEALWDSANFFPSLPEVINVSLFEFS